jgi:hypothetical protein
MRIDTLFLPPHSYYTLAAFVAIILSLAYSRFRGLFGQDNKNMSLTVKWGRERFVPPRSFFPVSTPDMPRVYRAPSRTFPIHPLTLLLGHHFRLTAP